MREIRRKQFLRLCGEYKRDVHLAEVIERSPSYVYQLKSGHRNFSEKVARHIESCTGKPKLWLDHLTDTENTTVKNKDSIELINEAIRLLNTMSNKDLIKAISILHVISPEKTKEEHSHKEKSA